MGSFTMQAQESISEKILHKSSPNSHAPIGVMGDHMHLKNEWMVSYRYMNMTMRELKEESKDVPFSKALNNYMVTPTRMDMQMHMIGVMYAPSDKITLSLMLPYTEYEMGHVTRMNRSFTTSNSGIGDITVSALYRLLKKSKANLHTQIGVTIPSGSIEGKDLTPASEPNEVLLPYPMQIGSGSWGINTALTYTYNADKWSFGAQIRLILRTNTNENDYIIGNAYRLTGWSGYAINNWLSFSGRLGIRVTERIDGSNPVLNPNMVITADTENSGVILSNASLGFNILLPDGFLKNLRLATEYSQPIYQNLNGIQLKVKSQVLIGLQYGF